MKLSKLYSNNDDFKEIKFNDQVNIIIGRIHNPENKKSNSHNLGKTLIVKLIDYMLLKDASSGGYFNDKIFEGYIFFLEIKLNNGKYATIKRCANSNVVSIKMHDDEDQCFKEEIHWDYLDYNVKGIKKNAQVVIQNLLGFDVLKDVKYRNSLTYFLRGQEDYNDPFQLNKYMKSKEKTWKPTLFELLGYNGDALSSIYNLNEKIDNTLLEIKQIKNHYGVKESELDKYQSIRSIIENRISELSQKTENFDFYLEEADISNELVKETEKNIASNNFKLYNLKNEIANIEEALECDITYDYEDVYNLYEEMGVLFPDLIKKKYDDLIEFNKKITKDRRNKLEESLNNKTNELHEVEQVLKTLNDKRVNVLNRLKEIESFQKYKDSQKQIISLNTNIEEINEKIEAIKEIGNKNAEIINDKKTLESLIGVIKTQIENGTEKGKEIKKNFSEFVKFIVGTDAVLSVEPVRTGNINFKFDFLNSEGVATKENKGHTYMKEICACMDLAIIKSYINSSYYRFTFHDGCLDGDDPKFAIAYLELIKILAKQGLQCIVTMIDSVVPKKPDGSMYELTDDEVVLELNDDPDGKGKLFGFNF